MPGFVKSRPENNDHYVEQMKDHPWYPIIKETHDKLTELIPGYNIGQIKEKFGGLRYYFDFPDVIVVNEKSWLNTEKKVRERANAFVTYAEAWVDGYEARREAASD